MVRNVSGVMALLFSKWSIFVVSGFLFLWLFVVEDISEGCVMVFSGYK